MVDQVLNVTDAASLGVALKAAKPAAQIVLPMRSVVDITGLTITPMMHGSRIMPFRLTSQAKRVGDYATVTSNSTAMSYLLRQYRGDAVNYNGWEFSGITIKPSNDQALVTEFNYKNDDINIHDIRFMYNAPVVVQNSHDVASSPVKDNPGWLVNNNVRFNRVLFHGAFDPNSNNHTGALYTFGTNVEVTNSIFINNGWQPGTGRDDTTDGRAPDIYKHAFYAAGGKGSVNTIRGCVFSDPSAAGISGRGHIVASDNVFLDCPTPDLAGMDKEPLGIMAIRERHLIIGGADINSKTPRRWNVLQATGLQGQAIYKDSLIVCNDKGLSTGQAVFVMQNKVGLSSYFSVRNVAVYGSAKYKYAFTTPDNKYITTNDPADLVPYGIFIDEQDFNLYPVNPIAMDVWLSILGFKAKADLNAAMVDDHTLPWSQMMREAAAKLWRFPALVG